MCDLDPKVKVIGKKAGICDGVPSTAALVIFFFTFFIGKREKGGFFHWEGVEFGPAGMANKALSTQMRLVSNSHLCNSRSVSSFQHF